MRTLLLLALIAFPSALSAQELHTFANGELADAEKINENFQYVLENATGSGGCSAEQDGSSVVITCADGTSGVLASAGTVVTFLDGQIGEIDYSFNVGDVIVEDANGVALGRFGGGSYEGQGDYIPIVIEEDPLLLLQAANDGSSEQVIYPFNIDLYYESSDCTGAPFYNDTISVNDVRQHQDKFYIYSGERFDGKVVNSSHNGARCAQTNAILRIASLMQQYIPASELLNAAYPLRLVQVP